MGPAAPSAGIDTPDVVFFNGKILTLDSAGSIASAVAVKNGKFESVGASDELRKLAGASTKLVDLNGRLVVPGFIDAHTHPAETILMKESWVDARFPGTASMRQALGKIRDRLSRTPKGDWVFVACVSASQNKFAEKRLPTKAELDAVSPDNPVVLANGTHMFVANSAALRALGVAKNNTMLKGGGRALLGKNGNPNGALIDGASALPITPTADQVKQYYAKEIPDFWNANGFTSILAVTPAAAVPVLQAVAQKIQPDIRYSISVWTALNGENLPDKLDVYKMPQGVDPAYYRFAAIKVWMDGENDARTGLMYERYRGRRETDPPGGRGSLTTPPDQLARFLDVANKNGAIAMIHCSGDKATDLCLNAIEHEAATGGETSIMRIEHFGMFQLSETQLKRAVALKKKRFFISIQPAWLLNLARANVTNMGSRRARTGFSFRSLIDAGLEPAAGTDVTGIYLTNVNPLLGIYAAVTRNSDLGVFEPKQAVSVIEALKMWTIWAAKAMGEEAAKGSIEPGKYADMAVLSDDVLTLPTEKLKEVRVVRTVLGGRTVYEAE